jgi:hypothetical protein
MPTQAAQSTPTLESQEPRVRARGVRQTRRAAVDPDEHLRIKTEARSQFAFAKVIDQRCPTHDVQPGQPCYVIASSARKQRVGLCGSRIRAAGYLGTPSVRPAIRRDRVAQ